MAIKGAVQFNFPRERRHIPFEHGTTFDGGDLIPLHHQDLLPGDTVKIKMSYVLRMLTPLNPVMDNAYLSVDAYFVPYRVIWTKFKQFMGQNDDTYWTETYNYTVPTAKWIPSGGSNPQRAHTIGAYFGLPAAVQGSPLTTGYSVSILPLRAYAQVYNYWYRNENVSMPVIFAKDNTSSTSVSGLDQAFTSNNFVYGATPLKSEKLPDYFTMLLPQPQKGAEQDILGKVYAGSQNVISGDEYINSALRWTKPAMPIAYGTAIADKVLTVGAANTVNGEDTLARGVVSNETGQSATPINLWSHTGVEALRTAIFRQHVLEIRAKSGSRYATETLPSLFGVSNSTALLDEAEYLGGFDKLINMTEVLSNSDTMQGNVDSSGNPLGRPVGANGAASKTTGDGYLCSFSASEHGLLLVLATVRHRETYFQGIERRWNRLSFWDWYLPQAAGLGMQPVYKRELNCDGLTDQDRTIFGYRDYGADYTFFPNRLSGLLNPLYGTAGLSSWTFGSVLSANPVLNSAFMKADKTGFDRTLAVDSSTLAAGMQFFGDFAFDIDLTSVIRSQRFPGMDRI